MLATDSLAAIFNGMVEKKQMSLTAIGDINDLMLV